jgi:hypothetical protein
MTDLEQALRDVAVIRRVLGAAEDVAAATRTVAELTPEWLAYERARDEAESYKDDLAAVEASARIAILAEYERTQNKAPVKGAGVRVLRKAIYKIADALTWCRANAPALLTVDEKAFVKADLPGSPIEWIETPSATLATDLSMYEDAE